MDIAELTNFVWQSLVVLAASLTFWYFVGGALLAAYLFGLGIARLRMSKADPVSAAYEGAVAGLTLAFICMATGMILFWQIDYVALALGLIIVVIIPWILVATLKARGEALEV